MVKTCMLCKKEWAPFNYFNKPRSFHKFPKNDVLKKKWMETIGLSAVPNTGVICSDHFNDSAFHDTDGNTTRRRLLSDAVPHDKNFDQLYTDHKPVLLTKNESDCSSPKIEIDDSPISETTTVSKDNISNDLKTFVDVPMEASINEETTASSDDIGKDFKIFVDLPMESSISEESTVSQDNSSNNFPRNRSRIVVHPVTKIRFMTGFRTEYIKKEDFVSDEAWQRFMRYTVHSKLRLKASYSRNVRKAKKVAKFKDLLEKIKREAEVSCG